MSSPEKPEDARRDWKERNQGTMPKATHGADQLQAGRDLAKPSESNGPNGSVRGEPGASGATGGGTHGGTGSLGGTGSPNSDTAKKGR